MATTLNNSGLVYPSSYTQTTKQENLTLGSSIQDQAGTSFTLSTRPYSGAAVKEIVFLFNTTYTGGPSQGYVTLYDASNTAFAWDSNSTKWSAVSSTSTWFAPSNISGSTELANAGAYLSNPHSVTIRIIRITSTKHYCEVVNAIKGSGNSTSYYLRGFLTGTQPPDYIAITGLTYASNTSAKVYWRL